MCINCAVRELHIKMQNEKRSIAKKQGYPVEGSDLDLDSYEDIEKNFNNLLPKAIERFQNDPELSELVASVVFQAERHAFQYAINNAFSHVKSAVTELLEEITSETGNDINPESKQYS